MHCDKDVELLQHFSFDGTIICSCLFILSGQETQTDMTAIRRRSPVRAQVPGHYPYPAMGPTPRYSYHMPMVPQQHSPASYVYGTVSPPPQYSPLPPPTTLLLSTTQPAEGHRKVQEPQPKKKGHNGQKMRDSSKHAGLKSNSKGKVQPVPSKPGTPPVEAKPVWKETTPREANISCPTYLLSTHFKSFIGVVLVSWVWIFIHFYQHYSLSYMLQQSGWIDNMPPRRLCSLRLHSDYCV